MNEVLSQKQPPRLYTLHEAAHSLGGISVWTLRGHVKRGTISPVRIGKRVLLSRETVEQIALLGLPSLSGPAV